MTPEEALTRLGESTGDALLDALRTFCGDAVEHGVPVVVPQGEPPLAEIPVPAVIVNVSYVDGVTGGNIFAMTRHGVQRLAAAMMGLGADEAGDGDELSELELSAAGEAMNQMMAAAAGATSALLGDQIEIGPPETRFFESPDQTADAYELTPHVVSVPFTVLDEPCRLVLLVPNAFIVKMTRALSDLEAEAAAGGIRTGGGVPGASLRRVPVRVWAELGRSHMPVGRAVSLQPGAVVDLDAAPDDPVQLYVNGRRFGSGRLLLIDNEWAVRVDEVLPSTAPTTSTRGGID
jgi:flagellar motor switch protein FliN/FliY